jgi:fimbrial isopeptide formation D2 family protein/LPXTG-motif cell wall-anchored protein
MKGKIRKLLSVVVATAMTLSCLSVPALADDTDYGNFTKDSTRFTLYQIFKGTPSNDGISNATWGANSLPTSGESVGGNVGQTALTELEAVENGTDIQKLNVIKKYWNQQSQAYTNTGNMKLKQQVIGDTDQAVYKAFNIEPGYYLIVDNEGSTVTDDGTGFSTGKYYSLYVTKTAGNSVLIEPKGSAAKVDKDIVMSDGSKVNSASASVGDNVTFQLTGQVASNIQSYGNYYYKFTDTLSKGLTYNNDAAVYIKNGDDGELIDVTKYFGKSCTEIKDDSGDVTGHTLAVAIADLKRLGNVTNSDGSYPYKIDGNTRVVVKYTAMLNEYSVVSTGATIGDDSADMLLTSGNTNKVKVTYSNNPNSSGTPSNNVPTEPTTPPDPGDGVETGDTAETHTTVYTTGIAITKSNDDGDLLAGAVFKLEGNGVNRVYTFGDKYTESTTGTYYKLLDGTYTTDAPTADTSDKYDSTTIKYTHEPVAEWITKSDTVSVTATSDSDGSIIFKGLGEGTYTLTELTAPSGYNLLTEPIVFTIEFNESNGTFGNEITPTSGIQGKSKLTSGMYPFMIINSANQGLPKTGGIGTTIFYVAGTILVLGAAVALITRRRMKGEVK